MDLVYPELMDYTRPTWRNLTSPSPSHVPNQNSTEHPEQRIDQLLPAHHQLNALECCTQKYELSQATPCHVTYRHKRQLKRKRRNIAIPKIPFHINIYRRQKIRHI